MVTCNPGTAAVTIVPRADLQHLVSGTHHCSRLLPPSLPVDRPPPAAGTAPALQGTNVLLLLGNRTGQTPDSQRTRERHGCPRSFTHLPSMPSDTSLIRATGDEVFCSNCNLDYSVCFSLTISLKAFIYSGHKHLLRLCYVPDNLLSARDIGLNNLFPVLEKVTIYWGRQDSPTNKS